MTTFVIAMIVSFFVSMTAQIVVTKRTWDEVSPPRKRRSILPRVICFVFIHRWVEKKVNLRKHYNLAHLHPMAGMYAECSRCGKVWDDLASPFYDYEVVDLPHELPAARVVDR